MGKQAAAPSNNLVLGPSPGPARPKPCRDGRETEIAGFEEVLAVTYDHSAAHWADEYVQQVGAVPDHLLVIGVGETVRSTAGRATTRARTMPTGPDVSVVEDPGDLTALAIQMDTCFQRWRGRDRPPGRRSVYFQSITAMLDHVDLETVFRFLHITTYQLSQAEAVGHFQIAPEAHDDETIATLTPLFDTVLESSDAGTGGSVRTSEP